MNGVSCGTMVALSCALALGACTSSVTSSAHCDAAGLTAALAAARSGDVVDVGVCRIDGSFVVPDGVLLRGVSPASSVLTSSSGIAVELHAGASLESIAIESSGHAALVARTAGAVTISGVTVTPTRGIGIGLEHASATLRDVAVVGPITSATAPTTATPGDATRTATFGLVAISATLDAHAVTVRGFASAGIALVDTTSMLSDSVIDTCVGVGVGVSGGSATLLRVDVRGTSHGSGPDAAALSVDRMATLDTTELRVSDNQGLGIFANGAGPQSHHQLVAASNGGAGVWTQASGALTIDGAGSAIDDNSFAGVVMVNGAFHVTDTVISQTRMATLGTVTAADGLQIINPSADSTLEDSVVYSNPRVGMVVDGAGSDHMSFHVTSMIATGTGTALGCVTQNGGFADGVWDMNIVRNDVAAANDTAFETANHSIGVVGVVGPGMIVGLGSLSSGGLASLL